MPVPQNNIDAAIRLIREALGPGSDGQSLHRALDLLTSEEEPAPAPAPSEGTNLMGNTYQPKTGVDFPDPAAPPFQGTTGGNNNAILAARAADGQDPVMYPEAQELGSADAGTATSSDSENQPAGGDLSASPPSTPHPDDEASIRNKAAREGVLDNNIADVKAAIATSTSVADLKKLRTDEENGKTRNGVIEAIDKAIEKLEAE